MKQKRVLCFFGTRPEAIKMAPVVEALGRNPHFKVLVAVSAQHREMLDQVMKLFDITPDIDLNIMQDGQSLYDVTARVLRSFESVLEKLTPDLVLVHGDTTTTLGGSIASYYKKIPIGHVEAGLRTGDKYRPFPEEMNRRMTDAVCTLYFAPTMESAANLKKENLNSDHIYITGNTVIDALLMTARRERPYESNELKGVMPGLSASGEKIILMTAHRRENFGKPFDEAFHAVKYLSLTHPDVHWIYPVHPNPNVTGPAHKILSGRPNIHLVKPLSYSDLVNVMKACTLVVTDSGGLQEEAPSLGKPVLVLRDVTERPEAVHAGTVKLVGTDAKKIKNSVKALLNENKEYQKMANAVNPYGDGRASERIAKAIEYYFGFTNNKPTTFKSAK